MYILTGVFLVQTIGELCLSPVGLSATSRLAPKAFESQAMALWYMATATGLALAAQLIKTMETMSDAQYYLVTAVITLAVAAGLFALAPWIHRKMASAEEFTARAPTASAH